MILLKARGLPAGTKRKWKDGVYIKGSDHQWHREKGTELAHAQLKRDKKYGDKELREYFEEAVHEYATHLHDIDTHPKYATPDTDDEFWQEFFGEENWFDDDGLVTLARKARQVVMKFHAHLQKEGKRAGSKSPTERIKKRSPVKFTNEIYAASAAAAVAKRHATLESVKMWDGKELEGKETFRALIGFSIAVNGEAGVLLNFRSYSNRGHQRMQFMGRNVKQVPELILLNDDGEFTVENKGPISILPDPERGKKSVEIKGALKTFGVHEIVFDPSISEVSRARWQKSLEGAFKEFNSKLGINFHDKLRIHIWDDSGSGVMRGASADYHSSTKTINLSTAKSQSFAALAHEIGHALDDKMGGWHGTDSWAIHQIVSAYHKTPQGQREWQQLEDEKTLRSLGLTRGRRVSRHTNWKNRPEERFARCFETYIAKKCPGWKRDGWAKEAIDDESFKMVKPLFDKLLRDKKVKKAIVIALRRMFA